MIGGADGITSLMVEGIVVEGIAPAAVGIHRQHTVGPGHLGGIGQYLDPVAIGILHLDEDQQVVARIDLQRPGRRQRAATAALGKRRLPDHVAIAVEIDGLDGRERIRRFLEGLILGLEGSAQGVQAVFEGEWIDALGDTRQAHEVMTTARSPGAAGAGRGGIEPLEQVPLALLQGRQQRFQILVLDACLLRGHRLFGVEFGRDGDLLPLADHGGIEAIGEIEEHSAIIRGHEGLALLQGATHPQLAEIARGIARPGLASDGDDGSDGHEPTPCVRSAYEAVPVRTADTQKLVQPQRPHYCTDGHGQACWPSALSRGWP